MIPRFYTSLLFLTAYLFKSNNSIPSLKDRYLLRPGRKVKPSEVMPGEMDKDILEDLIREVPELKTYLRRDKLRDTGVPFNQKVFFTTSTEVISAVDLEADYDSNWWDEEGTDTLRETIDNYDLPFETTSKPNSTTNRIPFATRWPYINQSQKAQALRNSGQYFRQGRYIKCYQCGLGGGDKPLSSLCDDAFSSSGHGKYHSIRNHLRISCKIQGSQRSDGTITYGTLYQWNRGLRRIRSGPFVGGCFKRYLDVGTIYTVRGCRSFPPFRGPHCTGLRFKRLEMMLKSTDNGCIASPSASLTPFARGISLFARYHVCVCNRNNYCNGVGKHDDVFASLLTVFISLYIVV